MVAWNYKLKEKKAGCKVSKMPKKILHLGVICLTLIFFNDDILELLTFCIYFKNSIFCNISSDKNTRFHYRV